MNDKHLTVRTLWILGDLSVDPGARSVVRGGTTIELPRLSFDLLLALIHAAPDALSTDDLMDRVWQGAMVSQATVAKRVELLRQALGDDSSDPQYVALVRGFGYRLATEPRRKEVAPIAAPRTAGNGIRKRPFLLALAALAVLAVAAVALLSLEKDSPPPDRTIAVLPFRSLTSDPGDQQFADGLAEEIAHELARSSALRVTGRSSSLRVRELDEGASAIGETLGVAHLLDGTVRRTGDRLRIVVQLTDTEDGLQRWTDSWDRSADDVLTIQQDIARRVSEQLEVALSGAEKFGTVPGTANAEAFTLYLKARSLMEYPYGSDLPRAQELLEQAVVYDPEFAEAWAFLGVAHLRRILWREPSYPLSPEQGLARARDAIERALASNPGTGFAYGGLAGIAWALEDDIAKAARMTEQFARFAPWELTAFSFAADLSKSLGRLEQARRLETYVLERDPLCTYCRVAHLGTLIAIGDYEAAERQARLLLINEPEVDIYVYYLGRILLLGGKPGEALATFETIGEDGFHLAGLAMASHTLGRADEAARIQEELESLHRGPGPFILAQVAAWLGQKERALELLNTWVSRPDWKASFQTHYLNPLFKELHDMPGWSGLLQRIGRLPEQVDTIEFDVTPYLDPDG